MMRAGELSWDLSAIMPGGWWSPDIVATIHTPFEGLKRDVLPEMPIDSG